MNHDRRVAIVTGASSGIGAATALTLADSFAGLVLHARSSAEALERVAQQARAAGAQVITVLGDLGDEHLPGRLVAQALEHFGRLDCVVANAGFPILKGFEDGSLGDLDRAFRGNSHSFFALAQAAGEALAAAPEGRIVAVGSFTAHVFRNDIRQFPLSAASKGALEVLVRSVAMALAPQQVTVNCVVPGFIQKPSGAQDSVSDEELTRTAQSIPLGRPGQPQDVASAIDYLASPAARYITGQTLHVNGGLHI